MSEERVVDAFAERAKTERRLQRTRRKNFRRREESKRSAQEDARLRSGVYEAFARESAVEQGLDPSVWPFVPLSAEAAAQMGREYALVHSVERNHRLRRAPPRVPPPAEPPDRPGRRVRFADPPVTGSMTDDSASRSGHEAGPKVSASAKGDGVYVSRVSAPAPSAVEKLTSVSRRQHGEGSPSGGGRREGALRPRPGPRFIGTRPPAECPPERRLGARHRGGRFGASGLAQRPWMS